MFILNTMFIQNNDDYSELDTKFISIKCNVISSHPETINI